MKNFALKRVFRLWLLVFLLIQSIFFVFYADARDHQLVLNLKNEQINYSIFFQDSQLMSDRLEKSKTKKNPGSFAGAMLETDADFCLQVMWTGWRAPGEKNNAENPVLFSEKDFRLVEYQKQTGPNKVQKLYLSLKGVNNPFEIMITYQLEWNTFYIKKKISVRDLKSECHFLQQIWPCYAIVFGNFKIVKTGGFGQPLAFNSKNTGVFFGLEYPSSINKLIYRGKNMLRIGCGHEIGDRIQKDWLESEWVVQALTPSNRVKDWFMKYVNNIRVAPLRPYLLYNSWYDLRAPEMVKKPINVMNENNVKRIIESFNQYLVSPYNINLDAFVLDDGWDIYRSDWVLRKKQFPRGLRPISDLLKLTNTSLGIWFGPTGGYSNRQWRLDWMKQHGYESVNNQLCLAGEKYKKLLKKRVIDFVVNDGVAYYKWDGIQFSCSQPDHGHATGIYSRRAVMESVIDLCQTVRGKNPKIFLNVTSGTWLSPWWVKYANTIWMQGYDYGYADVPSPSRRDRAMTYRDYVLFDGLKRNNFWFPIANLMTHGIIKGDLQTLGGESEPLDKFTDNALLYFARGVTMWELYVSPDLLNKGEWQALARSIRWAKDRFSTLTSTELIGGNPGERSPYGYIHWDENRVIIAARNPFIEPAILTVYMDSAPVPEMSVASLVLERTYPTRWISPELVNDRKEIKLSLQGYETAIYEMYPLRSANVPLLADAIFEELPCKGNHYCIKVLETGKNIKIMNPQKVKNIYCEGENVNVDLLGFKKTMVPPVLDKAGVRAKKQKNGYQFELDVDIHHTVKIARLAILLENVPSKGDAPLPFVQVSMDGKDLNPDFEMQKNRWLWVLVNVPAGNHIVNATLLTGEEGKIWSGKISVWMITDQEYPARILSFDLFEKVLLSPMPPRPYPSQILRQVIKLKEFCINDKNLKGVL